ncbi:MAG: PD-(D/E)XK nuclease family protein, partial [Bacteroidia bacterium]
MDFLDLVAKEYIDKETKDFSGYCFVFPTRRACLYFKKKFASSLTHPVWAPAVLPVEEFLGKLSTKQIADDIHLISELFLVYKDYFPEETFDKFYAWGELLLRDFDEIDRYLIAPELLFSNIEEFKEIQTLFQPDDEDLKSLQEFWNGFSGKELTSLRKEFYKTWKVLPQIYADFNKKLDESNFCYEGSAYKEIAEKISSGEIVIPWKKVIFSGFYALSKAEQIIFDHLLKQGKAEILRDIDEYYCNPAFEIARFTKSLPQEFKWKNKYFARDEKKIEMAGVPLLAGQAKYMGQKLKELINSKDFNPERTAVVLPDTGLLFPVLNSIPEEIEHINVTMGYPLKDTPLAGLITILSELHQHATSDNGIRFYHKDVTALLQNPLIRTIARHTLNSWFNLFNKEGWIFISADQLLNILPKEFEIVFRKIKYTPEIIPYLRDVLFMLSDHLENDELQPDFISGFISQLNKFENSLHDHLHLFDEVTCWRAIHELIHAGRIPFEGEPVDGIQIMGFLETRNLDFDNLIILSCNENLLPPPGKTGSFIPYPIRKGFGLPSYEEKDAISAYHFYRLLQRAKNITLIYDTEVKSVIGGEKSRFLLQIEHELAKNYQNIHLTKKIISTQIKREQVSGLNVDKTDDVVKLLQRFTDKGDNEIEKRLSASALIDYINCPMQFYFKHVARIKELTAPDEDLNAIPFGQVLHRAIEILYKEKDVLHLEDDKISSMIEAAVNTAIGEQFSNPDDIIKGKNILLRDVILELLKSIIRNDRQTADLVIKELESKLTLDFQLDNGLTVGLHGVADRVDFTENILRIIDYKTGHVYINKSLDIAKIFSDVKFKAVFQAFYYAYLFKRMKSPGMIKAGIYNLPRANAGIDFLSNDQVLSHDQIAQ